MHDQRLDHLTSDVLNTLRRRACNWFKKHGRSLPWRETRDPYRIWISEIMLQQTTVKAVIPYFERFIERFPNIKDLAAASEADVLKYWEGLGYYSRGRNLRKAAITVYEKFGGEFPRDLTELQSLPGVGRYTAGAIRSFAFDLPAPIVEANTLRLYCRLLNFAGDPRSRDGEKLLWEFAETLQSKRHASQLNQALMELGSQVCTAQAPKCDQCPLAPHCHTFAAGTQEAVPVKKSRPKVTEVVEATIAIKSGKKFLVRQRGEGERWAGMWDFLRFPVESVAFSQQLNPQRLADLRCELDIILSEHGLSKRTLQLITEVRHSVTRYRIRLLCLTGVVSKKSIPNALTGNYRWVTRQELFSLPMPITGREFSERLG